MKTTTSLSGFRWRKATDISREFALLELVKDDDQAILDIGLSGDGDLEISFNHAIILNWSELLEAVERGRLLAEADR
jgi:hypothetical protein